MHIVIATPAPARIPTGNRVTALRWARLLRGLGHRVDVRAAWEGGPCDALVALHARRSASSIERFASARPGAALIVALSGTDLYRDLRTSDEARRSLALAQRIVVLQPEALGELSEALRAKTRVILQSAERPRAVKPRRDAFQVCQLAHLRTVKDPFRLAMAVRLLPDSSRIRVVHLGRALDRDLGPRARSEEGTNPRYRWLGEVLRSRALRILSRSRLLVLASRMEGGANAIAEAVTAGVPVLSTRIPGSVGQLGPDYPGYFPVGDTQGLAALLDRAETDAAFYASLAKACRRRAPLFQPARERRAWRDLLREVATPRRAPRRTRTRPTPE